MRTEKESIFISFCSVALITSLSFFSVHFNFLCLFCRKTGYFHDLESIAVRCLI